VSYAPWNSNFSELEAVLRCEKPSRPVLFELFFNPSYYNTMAGKTPTNGSAIERLKVNVEAFHAYGFDYATVHACDMVFKKNPRKMLKTVSANDGFVITDWASFEAYEWPDPDSFDYSRLKDIEPFLPKGMKLMVMGPGGVLENAMELIGYDNLCYMLYDEPELAEAVFNEVGSRLVRYYENAMEYSSVGLLMSNDDWGFNTQTFLSLKDMRRLVFPWHTRIVETAHKHKKPAVLHSCGYLQDVMEDVIEVMKYDGRHSYEDVILPVEECYRRWGGRIAILGGMDMDFMVRRNTDDIHARARAMLELADQKGGYALGTGNSVPEYLPLEHYLALAKAAWEK
jgi:uroporphyrinogen decarboxylase